MAKQEGYILQESTNLAFESMGKQYKLTINLDSGLLILKKGEELILEKVIFLGEQESYTGENIKAEVTSKLVDESLCDEGTTNTSTNKNSKKKKRK